MLSNKHPLLGTPDDLQGDGFYSLFFQSCNSDAQA